MGTSCYRELVHSYPWPVFIVSLGPVQYRVDFDQSAYRHYWTNAIPKFRQNSPSRCYLHPLFAPSLRPVRNHLAPFSTAPVLSWTIWPAILSFLIINTRIQFWWINYPKFLLRSAPVHVLEPYPYFLFFLHRRSDRCVYSYPSGFTTGKKYLEPKKMLWWKHTNSLKLER